jgi:hypothetical protein
MERGATTRHEDVRAASAWGAFAGDPPDAAHRTSGSVNQWTADKERLEHMDETTNETVPERVETRRRRKRLGLLRDQRGASFSEYLVLIAIFVIAGIAIWNAFQTSVETKVDDTRDQLEVMNPDE